MYLDTASSEPLHPAARDALLAALDQGYADPRRLHTPARNARLILDNARQAVAEALGVRRDEVVFTASGTDAVHRGLLGLLRPGTSVAHSAVEHSSVLHALAWRTDVEARSVRVDRLGRMAVEDLGSPDVIALQHANHEVGTVQPVAEAAAVAPGLHGRLRLDGPPAPARGLVGGRGVGPQVGRPGRGRRAAGPQGASWRNPFPEDDRVDERVSGFENVPAALGAAAALQAVVAERDEVNARLHDLVDRIRAGVAEIPDTEVVGDPVDRLPHLVTFSFLYVDGEAIVDALNRRGFEVASGSACTASTLEPSHVLTAMGALTHGNVRVSLTRDATETDVDGVPGRAPRGRRSSSGGTRGL